MGEYEDEDKAKPEDHHIEDYEKDNEDEMWVRVRIRMKG